jgi:hypothetical protein
MEQLVARRAHNPKVVGSSPAPATNKSPHRISSVGAFFVVQKFILGQATKNKVLIAIIFASSPAINHYHTTSLCFHAFS